MEIAESPPSPLDPLGALIYYLCVTEALQAGGLIVPSSSSISKQLTVEQRGTDCRARDVRIQAVWEDLFWISQSGLLFHEPQYPKANFCRGLSQHNVNRRISQFRPGFELMNRRVRRLVRTDVVEKTGTAVRLAAFKDIYHFASSEVSQAILREFMGEEHLITDDDQYYGFLESMGAIHYLETYPIGALRPPLQRDRHFLVEPSDLFRGVDLYIELRALDYFSSTGGSPMQRHNRRLQLNANARDFCERRQRQS
jgi:hypothetical protein